MYIVRRLLWGVLTVVLTAFFAYGIIRLLRPELYGGQSLFWGTWHDVDRAVFRLTLGDPEIREMWLDGLWADVFLLAGGAAVAVAFGVAGGMWCASRPRSRAARALESVAMLLLCTTPGRALGADGAREGRLAPACRAPARGAVGVRHRRVAVRGVGADPRHEHRARRGDLLRARVLPAPAAGAGTEP